MGLFLYVEYIKLKMNYDIQHLMNASIRDNLFARDIVGIIMPKNKEIHDSGMRILNILLMEKLVITRNQSKVNDQVMSS